MRPQIVRRVAFWLSCIVAGSAWAHAVITGSSQRDRPIKAQVATAVTLRFNSGLEVALSRAFLVRTSDTQSPLSITASGKPGEIIVNLPALEAGDYAIKFRIFAADGHVTEDAIRFRVAP